MKKRTILKRLALPAVLLILMLVMLFSLIRIVETTILSANNIPTEPVRSKTIVRDGVDYFPRLDLTTFLILGIDNRGVVEESVSYTNTGAADLDVLLVFNETTETCTILQLNRDTMVEMPVLGIGGRQAGTYYGQLALAHTFGTGLHDSAENARNTICNLLYGIPIDYYAALRMDAIAILNDAVGGVTVEVTEDFSAVDPSIPMGTVTLMGSQAESFVRSRQGVGDQLNLSRMDRQRQYLEGFQEAFRAKREKDPHALLDAYEELEPYMVTDCASSTLTSLINRYGGFEITEIISPAGRNVAGEYMEFYLDEEKFDDLVLELFYEPKK